jgi:hypothetical protein
MKFTITHKREIRAGGSDGEVIGRVEFDDKRWRGFDAAGVDHSPRYGHRRAGDAASRIYRAWLEAGNTPPEQLTLFDQAKRTTRRVEEVEELGEPSPQYLSRKRIKLCAEWYMREEGKSRRQAFAMCNNMEEQGNLREDGSYIKQGGQRAETSSPEARGYKQIGRKDAAHGALWNFYWHPQDHDVIRTHFSPQTFRETAWQRIGEARTKAAACKLAGVPSEAVRGLVDGIMAGIDMRLGNKNTSGRMPLIQRADTGRRAVPPRVPRRLWLDAVEKMRAWKLAGSPDEGYADVQQAIGMCAVKMDDRSFGEVESRVEADAKYGFGLKRGRGAAIGPENLEEFRAAYNEAKADGKETFMFEGQEVLVAYAKYLLQHLDSLAHRGRRSKDKSSTGSALKPVASRSQQSPKRASVPVHVKRTRGRRPTSLTRVQAVARRQEIIRRFNAGAISASVANTLLAELGKRWPVLGTPVAHFVPPKGRRDEQDAEQFPSCWI